MSACSAHDLKSCKMLPIFLNLQNTPITQMLSFHYQSLRETPIFGISQE